MKKRIEEIDIVKALAIILIVCGHASSPINHFIYLFHVAVFFIASGFVYKSSDSDTIESVFAAVLKKIKQLWLPYFLYSTCFTLLHNFFIRINIYTDNPAIKDYVTGKYTTALEPLSALQMLKNIVRGGVFLNNTKLGGAFWFLFILFFICVAYVIGDYFARRISKKHADVIQLVASIILLGLGYLWHGQNVYCFTRGASFYILYYIGHILSQYRSKYSSWGNRQFLPLLAGSFCVLLIMNRLGSVELSQNSYENPAFLIVCSLAGWCFLYSIAYFIVKVEWLKRFFLCIGQRTLTILALHFLCFKVVAAIVVKVYDLPAFCIAAHPNLYGKVGLWWIAYVTVGVGIPVLLHLLVSNIYKGITKRFPKKNTDRGGNYPEIQNGRLDYLDGLRGYCSIIVVIGHLANVFLAGVITLDADGGFSQMASATIYRFLTAGDSAVQCFFVLSGFLIARKHYTKKENAVVSPISQYVKLLHIVIPGVFLAFFLMRFGLMFNLKAFELNPNMSFAAQYCNFIPSLFDAAKDAFIYSFVSGSSYVGPFWTIRYELFGAIMISAISWYAYTKSEYSKIIYLAMGALLYLISPHYLSFTAGAFAFDSIYRYNEDKTLLGRIIKLTFDVKALRILILIGGLYLFFLPTKMNGIWYLAKYLVLDVTALRAIGLSLVLICMEWMKNAQRILSVKPLKWLGGISAYTYAFHWPIVLSVGCACYVELHNYLSYPVIVALSVCAVFALTILLAWVFSKILSKLTKAENRLWYSLKQRFLYD